MSALEVPKNLQGNSYVQKMAYQLERTRNERGIVKAALADTASVRAGVTIGAGGLAYGVAERFVPQLGGELMGVPVAPVVGGVAVVAAAWSGSTMGVELAGGFLACGLRDLVKRAFTSNNTGATGANTGATGANGQT